MDILVEIFLDPDTGKQILVWKKEIPKTPPIIQSDIDMEDFELVIDETTGETVLRLKADVINRKGLTHLAQMNFEIVVDPMTGQSIIRIKDDGSKQATNRVEIVIDPITGKQTIRMVVDDNDDSNEPIVTITENDIDLNDFERVIDPATGREVLRMKADVLKSKGLDELANAEFEIVVDSVTGQSKLILKTSSIDPNGGSNINFEIIVDAITRKQKIIKKIIVKQEDDHVDIVESQLNINDFERVIDPNTGLEVLRLKQGVAARKGLTNLLDVQFEMITDADGKQKIVVKGGGNQGSSGDVKFELITDASGRMTIKVKKERPPTPELEVTEKPIDINDFEEIIDSKTGLKVLKLKSDVAKRAGMMDLLDVQFETYIDPNTGKQAIRVKQNDNNKLDEIQFEIVTDASGKQVLRMVQQIPKTVEVTNSDVNANDFEEIIDEKTGEKVLRMKKEVAQRKGFTDMDNVDFEYVIDQKTGQQIIRIKNDIGKLKKDHMSFEMITDSTTGEQALRMKHEVEKKFDTIENDLAYEDFEEVIDAATGERILKLTADAAARKGLTDLRDIAFEVYFDSTTGKEQIRMKGGNQTGQLDGGEKFEIYIDKKTGQQKIVLKKPKEQSPSPVEKSIDLNDFEKVIDSKTGKEVYRLTDEAIRRKGLTNIKDMEFDIEVDAATGKTVMKPKANLFNGQKVDVIVDPKTGKQTIRIVQEKPVEKLATITTTIDLEKKALSIQVDAKTGKQTMNLNKNLIENYGLENVEFEQIVDEKTGQTTYRMKPVVGKDEKVYELITDSKTGMQSLQVQEAVIPRQFTRLVKKREGKGHQIPNPVSGKTKISGQINEEQDTVPAEITPRPMKKGKASSPDKRTTTSPDKRTTTSPDKRTATSPDKRLTPSPDQKPTTTVNQRQSQVTFKPRPVRVQSASGQEYEIEWTAEDEKELHGLNVLEQRRRKQQMLAEKKRQVAEMKRQEELAIQQRLKKQRDSFVNILEQSSERFNKDEQDRERDLRKLDNDREGLTEEEYELRRKKLLAERTLVLKSAYDRKMDEQQQPTDNGDQEVQVHDEEDLLSMMNPTERENYIRARNAERARQREASERERVQREEELQAALTETKRMAAIRAAETMAKELKKRSANSMYAELRSLVTEQKVSRAFTYSYFSLLQFLSSNSSNPAD